MSAFKPFLQYFASGSDTPHVKITRSTNLLSVCRRKLKLSTYLHFVSYKHISFLNTPSQLVWVLARSGFYSITWRKISRSAGYKIHFRKTAFIQRKRFPLSVCHLFEFILLDNSFTAPVSSFNQINKQPENLYVNYENVLAISLSSQKPCCFNNVILHLNEIIKNAVIIRINYSCKSLHR